MTSYRVFVFKQNTAYEMRISDWSSDVCSSDLLGVKLRPLARLCKRRGPRLVKRGIGLIHGKARPVDLVRALSHQRIDDTAAVLDLAEADLPNVRRLIADTMGRLGFLIAILGVGLND